MKKIKNLIRGGLLSIGAAAILTVPTFAACQPGQALTGDYQGLMLQAQSTTTAPSNFPIKCPSSVTVNGTVYSIYAASSGDCSKAGSLAANPDSCDSQDLNSTIQAIINTIIFVIGIIAVVMVIIGGIQYSTSQGASDKVKKAKDTILYGIIGLVVAILAFAIVNFVLTSIF